MKIRQAWAADFPALKSLSQLPLFGAFYSLSFFPFQLDFFCSLPSFALVLISSFFFLSKMIKLHSFVSASVLACTIPYFQYTLRLQEFRLERSRDKLFILMFGLPPSRGWVFWFFFNWVVCALRNYGVENANCDNLHRLFTLRGE